MNWLRKALVWLRKEFMQNKKDLFVKVSLANVLGLVLTVLIDAFLPMVGWANILRSIVLVPAASAAFAGFYVVSLHFHFQKVYSGEPWVPYRSRYSPMWRRRIAIILGALLLVAIQAIVQGPFYTYAHVLIGAFIIAIFAFIRTSKEEAKREELGIPDSRDVVYDAQKRQQDKELALKASVRKDKRTALLKGKAKRDKS